MRIRKNAKLSSLLGLSSPPPGASQSHVCQLNQSPWDVIPFSPDSFPPSSPFHPSSHHYHYYQLDGELEPSLIGNTSFGHSLGVGAVDIGIEMATDNDSNTSRNWKQDEEAPHDNHDNGDNDDDKNNNDNDSYYGGDNAGGFASYERHRPASSAKKGGSGRRGRPPKRGLSSKPSSESNNWNQFYYYSGFSPSRGRRRAERGGRGGGGRERSRIEEVEESSGRSSEMPPLPLPLAGIGGEEEEEEEEEEMDYAFTNEMDEEEAGNGMNGELSKGGRKKTRKPVKARSLKSLM